MTKRVLITGVTGQDGSNMIDYLLRETDYEIYGTVRHLSVKNHDNIKHLEGNTRFHIVNMDLADQISINSVFTSVIPDYCINFAAQSFVKESWISPFQTFDINAMGVLRLLEALRATCPKCRFYSAGSSEEFGDVVYTPQDMNHPLRPRSPYGASKCSARHIVKVYRDSYKLYAIHATLYNHESIRRGVEFVTRKITIGIARIKHELENDLEVTPLEMGNINAIRDWSDSEDFIRAIWLMLQQDEPREYLISSDEAHSVKEFIELACEYAEINDLHWHGDELDTKLYSGNTVIVSINPEYYRPAEIDSLLGNSTESREILEWEPRTLFKDLVKKMILNDIKDITN